jgi:hypothetical protein
MYSFIPGILSDNTYFTQMHTVCAVIIYNHAVNEV